LTSCLLLAFLILLPTLDQNSAVGLPPPRWARSAYDRGIEEIHDFLDFLWGFSGLAT
jgi:hypothetical protein